MKQRLERHLAVHDETRSPGPIDLRLRVGTWSARDGRSFGAFLDTVEAELRLVVVETNMRPLALYGARRG
jgi:hypothetical protein